MLRYTPWGDDVPVWKDIANYLRMVVRETFLELNRQGRTASACLHPMAARFASSIVKYVSCSLETML